MILNFKYFLEFLDDFCIYIQRIFWKCLSLKKFLLALVLGLYCHPKNVKMKWCLDPQPTIQAKVCVVSLNKEAAYPNKGLSKILNVQTNKQTNKNSQNVQEKIKITHHAKNKESHNNRRKDIHRKGIHLTPTSK